MIKLEKILSRKSLFPIQNRNYKPKKSNMILSQIFKIVNIKKTKGTKNIKIISTEFMKIKNFKPIMMIMNWNWKCLTLIQKRVPTKSPVTIALKNKIKSKHIKIWSSTNKQNARLVNTFTIFMTVKIVLMIIAEWKTIMKT